MWFYYDSTGTRVGLQCGDITAYYIYNLQGDVVALTDAETGAVVATYEYDAWGNCTAVNNAAGYTIGTENPFRYRGYYYDAETGLYYLQSRYYNPAIGRFVNADAFATTDTTGIISANMFAYCENNPVNYSDPSGRWAGIDDIVTGPVDEIVIICILLLATALEIIDSYDIYSSQIYNGIEGPFGQQPELDTKPFMQRSDALSDIAGRHKLFECVEAANEMADYLKRSKKKAHVVELHFTGEYSKGWVVSDIRGGMTVSTNGYHVGIMYNNLVYCNIHPYGLPLAEWVEDFHGTGQKEVCIFPI